VVENAPAGITSAKSAGLTCFAVQTSLPEEYLKSADKIFRSIDDLSAFLIKS
jgi:beta-phosphoglucomutase-like phosphatase (HAD superfamily)